MGPKRKSTSPAGTPSKKRKAINLEIKSKVVKLYEGGQKMSTIARDLSLSHSTVSTIVKNKEKIMSAIKSSTSMNSTVITKQREGPISEMEKLLNLWLESCGFVLSFEFNFILSVCSSFISFIFDSFAVVFSV